MAQRGFAARIVGVLPGFFAEAISEKVGVAGAVLLGFLALSALTLATFAWHPLQRLEEAGRRGSGEAGQQTRLTSATSDPSGGSGKPSSRSRPNLRQSPRRFCLFSVL